MLVNAMNARTTIAATRASNLRDIDDISVRPFGLADARRRDEAPARAPE